MTERFRVMNHDDYELDYIADAENSFKKVDLYDCCDLLNEYNSLLGDGNDRETIGKLVDLLKSLNNENEEYKKALIELKEIGDYQYGRIKELSDENEQLKKGMIEVVDRYIRNVEHNPPSSARTYLKVKGALVNVREGLRDLLEDLK